MTHTRSRGPVHAPPRRLPGVLALVLALATAVLVAACGSSNNGAGSFGAGTTTEPGLETIGPIAT
jgi:hypothetical protein